MCRLALVVVLTVFCFPILADFDAAGIAYKQGDFETAAKEFMPLAERGDHRAMYALASMYAAGHGVEKNIDKAFDLFKKAASYGRADAMYKLGLMYEQGAGTRQNYRNALRYYQKSAKLGYPLSQYRFGLMYVQGKGIKKNITTAYAWLVIAGHFFIYESGKPQQEATTEDDFEQTIELVQQQEKERIANAILGELQAMRSQLNPDDIEEIRDTVIEFNRYKKQYHNPAVRNILADGSIDRLFLPDTLY